MKQPVDLARQFLAVAERDLDTFRLLAETRSIADESVGFHAQQALEKCLKAVLALHGVEFRRTHDLAVLLDLLDRQTGLIPPYAGELDDLTPYAVILRYDILGSNPLDRGHVRTMVEAVHRWADEQINAGGQGEESGAEC